MRKVYDLSGTMENDMWDYRVLPGMDEFIPEVEIRAVADVGREGFFSSALKFTTITGTYLEAGSHILENGRNLDSYDIENFIKPSKIVHISGITKKQLISGEQLEKNAPEINDGDALLIDTGWGRHWNQSGYVLECPNFSYEALEWILDKKISILGVDVPCIEAAWSEDSKESKGGMLKKIFESGCLLAAPLVNLDNIKEPQGVVFCFPLKVKDVSGAPARIVFMADV